MTGDGEPRVSVVTPFYNTEKYLAECIESVLSQTYRRFEYLLVNNCSTDGSAEIAARYAATDPRIRLLHNKTLLPQVENYNQALRQISPESKYCKIVQADDWIYPNCLLEMVQAAEAVPDVVLVGSYSLYDPMPDIDTRPYVGNTGLDYTSRVLPGMECARRYLLDWLPPLGSPTCVMYRAHEVRARDAFFGVKSPVEDIEVCLDLLQNGQFAFVHQVLTFNRRERESFWWRMSVNDGQVLVRYIVMYKYAPRILTPEEAKKAIRQARHSHYRALGRALLSLRPRAYWRLHSDGLAGIGQRIEKGRLMLYCGLALLDWLTNPKLSLENWLRVRGLQR